MSERVVNRIRFHLHVDVSPRIAEALRGRGIDTTTNAENGLQAAAGRVLVTRDVDFLRLARSATNHAGLVSWQRPAVTEHDIIKGLSMLWETTTPQDMEGRVEYL